MVHSTGFSIEMILRKRAYLKIISIEKERSDTSFESRDGKKDFLLTVATKRSIFWTYRFYHRIGWCRREGTILRPRAYESRALTN